MGHIRPLSAKGAGQRSDIKLVRGCSSSSEGSIIQRLPLHLLLKLLQIRFFRGEETSRFVGQDKCYVYARSGGGDFHYCVEIGLKGAPTNTESSPTQEFRIIPYARRFGKIEPPFQPSRPLFGK